MIVTNDYGNCTTDTLGSGERSCDLASFGDATGFGLTTKDWSLDKTTDDFEETDYREFLKGFKIFPFLSIYDFTDATPENEKNTSKTGRLRSIRDGKPQMSFMFDKGSCFHKALYDKRGDGRWNLVIFFETGILLAEDKNGILEGFDMGMFSVETFKLLNGTDPQMSTAMIQLLDAVQYNAFHRFITWESLGWNGNRIGGVVETAITYAIAPAASATFALKVASGCNSGDLILGLDQASSWALGGTAVVTISTVVYNAVNNTYVFTLSGPLASGISVQPKLVSAGGFSVAEDDDGNLFKGEAPLKAVA